MANDARSLAKAAPATATTAAQHDISALLDSVIAAAPQLVRQRHLIGSVDWRQATAAQVERLAAILDDARSPIPGWLSRDIMLAGHTLPTTPIDFPSELALLQQVNASSTPPTPQLATQIRDAISAGTLSAETTGALVERLLACDAEALACEVALGGWPQVPQALRRVRKQLPSLLQGLPRVSARVVAFSTIAPFTEALTPAFAARGLRIEPTEAAFATVIAELLAPRRDTQVLLVVLDQMTLIDDDWRGGAGAHASQLDARLSSLTDAIGQYATTAATPLLINTLAATTDPSLGHIDTSHPAGRAAAIRRVNAALAEVANTHANVQLVDADYALSNLAPDRRTDPRMWFYGRIAYTDAAMRALAGAFAAAWAARVSSPVKVIALDFDNTLWGGVFGDDGLARLACGDDAPGNAFKAFQAECLRLKAQGKLLVGVSKNNADAIDVFERHPGMLLKASDFAATAIDWQPKPDNIRRLADELNLGVDSFLFLDDSPHEREAMRRMCPQVRVPEMPADPALRPSWLRRLTDTWPTRLTSEDAERSAMYDAERQARTLRAGAASYEDYLRNLDQQLEVAPLSAATLPRIAQLHERTNQFNLTTRRFTEGELAAFMADLEHAVVLTGTASDRFGSHGIVITAVARIDGTTAHVESLLMSCRVISRQIETAFVGALLEHLTQRGVTDVVGRFLPTAKNAMVKDLYPAHGFAPQTSEEEQASQWLWRSGVQPLPASAFVSVKWSTR